MTQPYRLVSWDKMSPCGHRYLMREANIRRCIATLEHICTWRWQELAKWIREDIRTVVRRAGEDIEEDEGDEE